MSTLTIFFNSDSDIAVSGEAYEPPIHGLDKINTASRPLLISALSNERARFIHHAAKLYFNEDLPPQVPTVFFQRKLHY